jgi:hypothetical protein
MRRSDGAEGAEPLFLPIPAAPNPAGAIPAGWTQTPDWWQDHPAVSHLHHAILVNLRRAARSQAHGWCWRSQVKMAELLKAPRPVVNRAIRELVEARLLIKRTRTGANGGTASCDYLVAVERPFREDEMDRLQPPPGYRSRAGRPAPAQAGTSARSDRGGADPDRMDAAPVQQELPFAETDAAVRHPAETPDPDPSGASVAAGPDLPENPCSPENTPCHLDSERESPAKPDFTSSLSQAPAGEPLPISPGWMPTAADFAWARCRRPDVDPLLLTEKFILGCLARGTGYRDPSAAWRKWLIAERTTIHAAAKPSRAERPLPNRTAQRQLDAGRDDANAEALGAALGAVLSRRSGHAAAGTA